MQLSPPRNLCFRPCPLVGLTKIKTKEQISMKLGWRMGLGPELDLDKRTDSGIFSYLCTRAFKKKKKKKDTSLI